jgi:hypothetical protein
VAALAAAGGAAVGALFAGGVVTVDAFFPTPPSAPAGDRGGAGPERGSLTDDGRAAGRDSLSPTAAGGPPGALFDPEEPPR